MKWMQRNIIGATATGDPSAIRSLLSGAQQAPGEVAPIFAHTHSKRRNPQLGRHRGNLHPRATLLARRCAPPRLCSLSDF